MLAYMHFFEISKGVYAPNFLPNQLNRLRKYQNSCKSHLVNKNSVWRRLRRAKKGSIGKNKFQKGYFQKRRICTFCDFEAYMHSGVYALLKSRYTHCS